MALTAAEEAQTRELLAQQAAILSLADSEPAILSNLGATDVSLSDLIAASTINDADLLLIRQGTTDKSIAGSVVKLAATPGDASTTAKGVVELATSAETQTGTDAVRVVTPATLASVTATETRAGLAELATDAEAQSFTANKFIDGAKLLSAFKGANQTLTTNGSQTLPGGLIIKWVVGAVDPANATEPTQTLAYTTPFSTASLAEFVSTRISGTSPTTDFWYQTFNATINGCSVQRQTPPSPSTSTTSTPILFAIGY